MEKMWLHLFDGSIKIHLHRVGELEETVVMLFLALFCAFNIVEVLPFDSLAENYVL